MEAIITAVLARVAVAIVEVFIDWFVQSVLA
jgi:hypothetical protein